MELRKGSGARSTKELKCVFALNFKNSLKIACKTIQVHSNFKMTNFKNVSETAPSSSFKTPRTNTGAEAGRIMHSTINPLGRLRWLYVIISLRFRNHLAWSLAPTHCHHRHSFPRTLDKQPGASTVMRSLTTWWHVNTPLLCIVICVSVTDINRFCSPNHGGNIDSCIILQCHSMLLHAAILTKSQYNCWRLLWWWWLGYSVNS